MLYSGVKYSNGAVPSSILALADGSVLTGAPAYLRADAADAWNRARKEVKAKTGIVLGLRGWNRTLAEQERFFLERYRPQATGGGPFGDVRTYKKVRHVRYKGAAAAIPGTSNHGEGLAVDVDDFGTVGQFDYPRRVKTIAILKKHGWTDTEGRGIDEPWHLVYDPSKDKGKTKPVTLNVKGWQKQLRTTADGVISKADSSVVRAAQRKINGKNGRGGYRLKQGPLKVTGALTKRDIQAIQKLINLWAKKRKLTLKQGPLKINGKWDRRTKIAFNRSITNNLWK